MREIEDELERMAAEFTIQAEKTRKISADNGDTDDDESTMLGIAMATMGCADRLRLRAAEISAARIGYKAQTKPSIVVPGQWWMWRLNNGSWDTPGRVDGLGHKRATLTAPRGDQIEEPVEDLLWSTRWLYLGDGPEPTRV